MQSKFLNFVSIIAVYNYFQYFSNRIIINEHGKGLDTIFSEVEK